MLFFLCKDERPIVYSCSPVHSLYLLTRWFSLLVKVGSVTPFCPPLATPFVCNFLCFDDVLSSAATNVMFTIFVLTLSISFSSFFFCSVSFSLFSLSLYLSLSFSLFFNHAFFNLFIFLSVLLLYYFLCENLSFS